MFVTQAGIYKIAKNQNGDYMLQYYMSAFPLPDKLYGSITKYAERFWKAYAYGKTSLGALLTGNKGSGKTELAKYFANIAVNNNIPVVLITDIQTDIKLVEYLSTINNAILIFEEFGKNFSRDLQDKMLTMLSVLDGKKKFFFITENNKFSVSDFIIDRPGRIHYHIDYSRIEREVIKEFCEDNNVSKKLYDELITRYEKVPKFNFDHMQAIVLEHKSYPNESLNDLIKVLNVKFMNVTEYYYLASVKNIAKNYECIIESDGIGNANERGYRYEDITDGRSIYTGFIDYDKDKYATDTEKILKSDDPNAIMTLSRTLPRPKHITLTKDKISNISRDESVITFINDNYEITYELKRSEL